MEPEELSNWHNSALGHAVCDTCNGRWPCHLSAWGRPDRTSSCNRCPEGIVRFVYEKPIPKVKLDPGYMEKGG